MVHLLLIHHASLHIYRGGREVELRVLHPRKHVSLYTSGDHLITVNYYRVQLREASLVWRAAELQEQVARWLWRPWQDTLA